MSFGKDSGGLSNVGSWRQAASQATAKPARRGGGGRAPTWVNSFRPSTNDPDEGRLIAGKYEVPIVQEDGSLGIQIVPFFPYTEHYDGRHDTSSICSAGPYANDRNKREPCHGCDIFWADFAANKNNKGSGPAPKRMSKRDMFAFNWFHNAPYVKVPQIDKKTGQFRTNQQGEPYTQWIPLLPHERTKFPEDRFEIKMGHTLHWSMGYGHFKSLLEYDKLIGKSCKACGSRDTIESEAWICGNDECGDAVIELGTTTLPAADIEKIVMQPVLCPTCGLRAFAREIIHCKQCGNATRATLFDVDIAVKRIEGREGSNQTSLAVTSWSHPRDLDPALIEQVVVEDLTKIFAPNTLEFQAEKFRYTPSAPSASATPGLTRQPSNQGHTRGYSKP